MARRRHGRSGHAALIVAVWLGLASDAQAFDLFYLSVGNSAYRNSDLDIPDANVSARQVAHHLDRMGAEAGITLLSEPGAHVTREDVMHALDDIVERARGAEDPLVVYYFVGHGAFSDGDWGHLSLTGAHVGTGGGPETGPSPTGGFALGFPAGLGLPTAPPAGGLAARDRTGAGVVLTRDIETRLEERRLPHILILDNCYYRAPAEGLFALSYATGDKMIEAGRSLRNLQFGSYTGSPVGWRIVLYAAGVAKTVRTLPHPDSDRYSIGPLARRVLLVVKEAWADGRPRSIGEFRNRMIDPDFDPASAPGLHEAVLRDRDRRLVPAAATDAGGMGEQRRGTGGPRG